MMLPADFDWIDASHVENLVAAAVPEDCQLEYKQALIDKDADKKVLVTSRRSPIRSAATSSSASRRSATRTEADGNSLIGPSDLIVEADRVRIDAIIHAGLAPKVSLFAQNSSSARPAPCW